MQELQLLNDKLDMLLRKYAALQAENNQLKETVGTQLRSIETLNTKLASLEENMVATGIDKTLASSDDKTAMRKQLDNVIGEIDKILNTLND
jgi:uncharacterized coiled-coil DUF342 family protein